MPQNRVTYRVMYAPNPPVVVSWGGSERPDADGAIGRLCRDPAGPERDNGRSLRTFQIVPDGRAPVARVTTEQTLGSRASGRAAAYRVDDAAGTPLARITFRRRPLLRLGRTQWTVEPVAGPALQGYRGRLVWWALWWPIGLPLSLVWGITSLLGEGDGGFGAPRRIIWRDSSGRAHLVFRGLADEYRVLGQGLAPRVVAALVALHQSFDPSDGGGALGWYETA
ncbi:hypothetical protein [Streptomyces sp. BA2]|uniref:hypothetical protein n=1 Tax=Streptomyces sp. BA2 TaxID=436595 RepID=UPI00132B8A67|nr:hypothetical protein [Streptomyces sp. BA2]MWA15592.1 hypothetical protein [Streptomyces sp. BA2]